MKNFQPENKKGVILLITVLILTAVLSISIGVFNVLFGEIVITGSVEDSFRAFDAADHGIERTLYRDRMAGGPLADGQNENATLSTAGACYEMTVVKAGLFTQIRVVGEYTCGGGPHGVKRAFRVTYN